METPLTAYQVGPYRLQDWIGRSRLGPVFQAVDPASDRPVAVTLLSPRLASEPGFVPHLTRRLESMACLQHPNILRVRHLARAGQQYYLVTEYTKGLRLSRLLGQVGAMHPTQAGPILEQLAAALDYAHAQGWIYGDLGPDMVLIDPHGRVLLSDRDVLWNGTESEAGGLGFSAYTAPEQITGGEIGPWTDRYALGVMVYAMLCGEVPFQAQATAALLHQITHQQPPPLHGRWPDLSEEVDQVLGSMLAKEPAQRYESATRFAVSLGTAFGQVAAPTPSTAQMVAPSFGLEATAAVVGIPGKVAVALPSPEPLAPPPGPAVATTAGSASAGGPTALPQPPRLALPLREEAPSTLPAAQGRLTAPEAPARTERPERPRPEPVPASPPMPSWSPAHVPLPPSPPTPRARLTPLAPPAEEPPRRAPLWPWVLLATEALILLAGLVLLILFLRGIL